jgi:hypothetical protein
MFMKRAADSIGQFLFQLRNLLDARRSARHRRPQRTRRGSQTESLETRELLAAAVTNTSFLATGTLSSGATSLTVTFSESILGGATSGNYELRRAGTDGVIGSGDDQVISFTSVVNSETTGVTTLGFSSLADDAYRLTVKDQITDTSGVFLDGDANGVQGGNYVKEFIVGGQVKSFEGTATPSTVNGLSNVTEVAAGVGHFLALRTDGTVWSWGNNSNGQLGDGTTISRTSPVQVTGLTNVTTVVAGSYCSFASWGRYHDESSQSGRDPWAERRQAVVINASRLCIGRDSYSGTPE